MPDAARTRLAPSPTGALHLGNVRTFIINWALARQRGWRILLRIEDLDGPRVRADADRQAIDLLQWLGLDWDEGPVYQRADLSAYEQALERLGRAGLIYPCRCTRREIAEAQSAPHGDDHELRYPGVCRPDRPMPIEFRSVVTDDALALRLRVPDEVIAFDDEFCGRQSVNVQQQVGDFIVAAKNGLPAYQLAVVVDDARQGVTHIVRGDDLLRSAPRQMLVYRMLALGPPPSHLHLPLVIGPDGRRLAKRHGDTRLARYRAEGVPAERVIGLMARWCGMGEVDAMSIDEFRQGFDLARLPRRPVAFTDDDEARLAADTTSRPIASRSKP